MSGPLEPTCGRFKLTATPVTQKTPAEFESVEILHSAHQQNNY